MKKKYILFAIGLALVFSNVGAAQEVCDEFADHVRDVYFQKLEQRGNRAEFLAFSSDVVKVAQVSGYALGNQQQYVKESADKHFYKKCEQQNREFIKKHVIGIARVNGWSEELISNLEARALREFERATAGYLDVEMALFTGVKSNDAPNFVAAPNKVCDKFDAHVKDVYYSGLWQRLTRVEKVALERDMIKVAQIAGYAVGNQLQYVNRGSSADDFYKKCEQQATQFVKNHVILMARSAGWSEEFTGGMMARALSAFQKATAGFYDTEMALFTGVKSKDAPNFFGTVSSTRIQTGNVNPAIASDAIVPPPAGPDALGLDRVAGDYDIYRSVENDKPQGTLRVRGTMDEATFDFRIVYQGRLTNHWKGTVTLSRGESGKKVRRLRGAGHNQLSRRSLGCWMMIEKGADNSWRASSLYIIGSLYNLVPR